MGNQYQIISFNGQFINRADFNASIDNRAFRFGDGLFETMHANGGEVQFLNDHFNRLLRGAKTLKLNLPEEFSIEYLKNHVQGLLNRCKLYQGAKVRLMVYRSGAGLFIPETNTVDVIIEATYLSKGPYQINENGLVIDFYTDNEFVKSPYTSFKSMNSIPYILGGVYAKEHKLDDVLFVNNDGEIVEASSSNVFCLKGKQLFTPNIKTGCVDGVMRRNVMRIAEQRGFEQIKSAIIDQDFLFEMDEVFLTNAISGIKWVTAIKQRRYYKRYSVKLLRELNQQLFG